MTTTLTGKNQITVPAEIARKLGLTPGSKLNWTVGNKPNKIIITIKPSRKQLLEEVRAIGRKVKRSGVDEVAEFLKWRDEDDKLRQDVLK